MNENTFLTEIYKGKCLHLFFEILGTPQSHNFSTLSSGYPNVFCKQCKSLYTLYFWLCIETYSGRGCVSKQKIWTFHFSWTQFGHKCIYDYWNVKCTYRLQDILHWYNCICDEICYFRYQELWTFADFRILISIILNSIDTCINDRYLYTWNTNVISMHSGTAFIST